MKFEHTIRHWIIKEKFPVMSVSNFAGPQMQKRAQKGNYFLRTVSFGLFKSRELQKDNTFFKFMF